MIYFVTTRDHAYTLRSMRRKMGKGRLRGISYDRLFRSRRIPYGTYIFTDQERLAPWESRLAALAFQAVARSGARALNNPATVKWRYGLLRALHEAGINSFDAYRPDEARLPRRYPVFIRDESDHRVPVSDLIHSEPELLENLDRLTRDGQPMQGLIIVEYAAEPIGPELFRKHASFCIDGKASGMHLVHDHVWLVKYGAKSTARESNKQAELDFIRDNLFRDTIERAFKIANIEYGRADFGIVDGEPQIYEINTNPYVSFAGGSNSPLYEQAMAIASDRFYAALDALDSGPARGRTIDLGNALGGRIERLVQSFYARRPRP